MVHLNRPSSLIDGKHLSCRQLGEIGHQYFGSFRARVRPFFTQHHGDIANVTKTSALSEYPEGLAYLIIGQVRNPSSLKSCAGNVLNQIAETLAVFHVPGPGNSEHKTPTSFRVRLIQLLDQLHIVFRGKCSIGGDDNELGPLGRFESFEHLAE